MTLIEFTDAAGVTHTWKEADGDFSVSVDGANKVTVTLKGGRVFEDGTTYTFTEEYDGSSEPVLQGGPTWHS